MIEVVESMVNLAINDGAVRFTAWRHRIGREGTKREDGTHQSIEEFREEAKQFIREAFKGKTILRIIEEYWANPHCKDCGVHVTWPREYCFECLSPKEREDKVKLSNRRGQERKRERRNAKLLGERSDLD
jgi:hypothetical protein